MSSVNVSQPTVAEVDAAEEAISQAFDGTKADGYWRHSAVAVLEAAKEARLKEFLAECDGLSKGNPEKGPLTSPSYHVSVGQTLADELDGALGEQRR